LRTEGLSEVTTPVYVRAGAIEPYIEPLPCGDGYLRTSPELAHKRLIAAGAGPLFEVAPVFRQSEYGAHHREGFHLLEWYRLGSDAAVMRRDVELLVDVVSEAVGELTGQRHASPRVWIERGLLELMEETTGVRLLGDEDAPALRAKIAAVTPSLWIDPPGTARSDLWADVHHLAAWTTWFTTWSNAVFDPWLYEVRDLGVHVVDFPPALAALAQCGPPLRPRPGATMAAGRFESYVAGVELCNGYRELQDPHEQLQRFATAAGLRTAEGLEPLPLPKAFLAALEHPGLPACVGAALGLERLLMVAAGANDLADVLLPDLA
jgi:lysyl-tRNA synthetase class 2